jgi:XTP/dITP diphosphohydrolase
VRLVLATANPDKAREIADLLQGFEVAPRPAEVGDVDETADTLEGNARLKAAAVAAVVAVAGEVAVADDTGLEVDALGGRPGVWAARYAGEDATYADNVVKLLSELEGVPPGEGRRARFRTVALAAWPDGREVVAEGTVEGEIAMAARGEGGFGYDPVFVPDGSGGRTFAEMTAAEKNAMSHRARAFAALVARLDGTGPTPPPTPPPPTP